MKQYHDLCERILTEGTQKNDRTGTGTLSVFGHQMRFNLAEGFPLLTTKDLGGIRLDGIIYELLWFLSGDTNIKALVDKGVNIWNRDAYSWYKKHNADYMTYEDFVSSIKHNEDFARAHGNLGPIYSKQWRSWPIRVERSFMVTSTIDQISEVIKSLKEDPDSRRHIVSAWNPSDIPQMALPPCHVLFQFYVSDGKLSCQLYQRSGDVFLGVPYNIASYSLLTMMIANQVGLGYGEFVHTLGDAHIYNNHIEQVQDQLTRTPKPLPMMYVNPFIEDIFEYSREDFELVGYDPYPSIKGAQSF